MRRGKTHSFTGTAFFGEGVTGIVTFTVKAGADFAGGEVKLANSLFTTSPEGAEVSGTDVTATATLDTSYIVDFNKPIATGSPNFKVASNWKHIVDKYSDYYDEYYMSYSYKTADGFDGTGALYAARQYAGDNWGGKVVNDLLVTPLVSGAITMKVMASSTASSSYPSFVEIYKINADGTQGDLIQKSSVQITRRLCDQLAAGNPGGLQKSQNPLLQDVYVQMRTRLLRPKVIVDYTRENVQGQYGTLDKFIHTWSAEEKKKAIAEALAKQGIDLDKLKRDMGMADVDDYDFICHVAYDQKPLTRRERAEGVKKRDFLHRFKDAAREVLEILLDKYMNLGIKEIETTTVLKLAEFQKFGTPGSIAKLFGGNKGYKETVRELAKEIYKNEDKAG